MTLTGSSTQGRMQIGRAVIGALAMLGACSSNPASLPVGGSGGNATGGNGSGGSVGAGESGGAGGSRSAGVGGSGIGAGGAGVGGGTGSGGEPSRMGGSVVGGSAGSGMGGSTAGSGGAPVGMGGSGGGNGSAGAAGAGGTTGAGGAAGTGGAIAAGGAVGAGGAVACLPAIPVTTGTAVTVTVSLDGPPLATVSPDLMGIHTAVYDGLLTTSATTEALLKAAGVTSLRYPGGSYADQYHWESHTATATPAAGAGSNVIYVDPTANFGSFVSLLQRLGANALITVDYGMNSAGTGPGQPQEAAAWVAYANGSPTDTTVIGMDGSTPAVDWKTVGYWAGLRAAAPLATDDGRNFLRINRVAPIGIKYWEIGNELYGNGYYNGSATSAGWEPDMHAPYSGTNGTARLNNPNLSPSTYGTGVGLFAKAMKAVDSTIRVGGVLNWPDTSYAGFNVGVLGPACASMDFAAVHWYPGSTIASLLTIPRTDIPAMWSGLHAVMATNCGTTGRGATMPIAITEWGPNTLYGTAAIIGRTWHPVPPGVPSQTQVGGIFAAESYATFMEQGALAVHWAQLHDNQYLMPTPQPDTPGFGYHGQLIAHYLAAGGDTMKPTTSTVSTLSAHAALRADGGINVMLTNISPTAAANVTVNLAGGTSMFACAGTRYAYAPVSTNLDGPVSAGQAIYAPGTGSSVSVAVPAYAVVVIAFAKR